MTVSAVINHAVPGRLRLKIAEKKGDASYFAQLAEQLKALDSVASVKANSQTGSVVIHHFGEQSDVLDTFSSQKHLFVLENAGERLNHTDNQVTLMESFIDAFQQSDSRIRTSTRNTLDLPSLIFLVFLVLGVRQIVRGNFAAPGLAMFWYAFEMIHFMKQEKSSAKITGQKK